MLLKFHPQFIPAILSGQKGFTLKKNKRDPEPKIGDVISMVTGDHAYIITKKNNYKGEEKVRLIIQKKALGPKLLVFFNDRPLSESETMLFCFLDGFNSTQDFCDYWLNGAKEIELTRYMYRWIELPF